MINKSVFPIPENFLVSGGDTSFFSCFNELALLSCCDDNVSNRYLIYWLAEKSLSKKNVNVLVFSSGNWQSVSILIECELFEMAGDHWSVASRVIARSSRQIPLKIDSFCSTRETLYWIFLLSSNQLSKFHRVLHQSGKVIELKNIFKLALECSSHLMLQRTRVEKCAKKSKIHFLSHFGLWVGHSVWRSQFTHFYWESFLFDIYSSMSTSPQRELIKIVIIFPILYRYMFFYFYLPKMECQH